MNKYYQIYSKDSKLKKEQVLKLRQKWLSGYILAAIIPFIVVIILYNILGHRPWGYEILEWVLALFFYLTLFIAGLATIVGIIGIIGFIISLAKTRRDNIKDEEIEEKKISAKLNQVLSNSKEIMVQLPIYLDETSKLIEKAKSEFNERLFAPFWDTIEYATAKLYTFKNESNKLSSNAKFYYESLKDREHNFPKFVLTQNNLPQPNYVMNNLHHTIRAAQKDFQFANIWEHRQTRKVIIQGFNTLGEAIYNLTDSITYAITDLKESVSLGFDD